MQTLRVGSRGPLVKTLQQRLRDAGFNPGKIDGKFQSGTQAALIAFQAAHGLLTDGVAGPRTLNALGLAASPELPSVVDRFTVPVVAKMFPVTPRANITQNLPFVLDAAARARLADRIMLLMALATIRAETESFKPISEGRSRFNTSPGGAAFDLYDNRADIGNRGAPDGQRYRGRGYVQLTGRDNYSRYGRRLGMGSRLLEQPDDANDPTIAADVLMAFLGDKERAIKEAILDRNFLQARRLVNGGSHGLQRFTEAFQIGERLVPV